MAGLAGVQHTILHYTILHMYIPSIGCVLHVIFISLDLAPLEQPIVTCINLTSATSA
jgi:hypothetical protein